MNKKKNFKFLRIDSKSSSGFTLIEMLAAIIVLIALGSIVTGIVWTSLRGNNKASTVSNVRQNGNYALSIMSKMIRDAKYFKGVSIDGSSYSTDCYQTIANPSPTPIPYQYLKIKSFDDGETIFSCTEDNISSNSGTIDVSLLDSNSVSLASCYFECSQPSFSDYPTIKINFELTATGSAFENQASIPFETSVTLRNFER